MLDRGHVLGDQRGHPVRPALTRMVEWCEWQRQIEAGTGDVQREPCAVHLDVRAVISRGELQTDPLGERPPIDALGVHPAYAAPRFELT